MKKLFSSLSMFLLIMLFALSANAQLTGTKTIPGTYATVDAAIADLNAQGVGAGGVTFNVAAGYTETAPIGGYAITTLTGSAANPIIFQKSGVGTNPTFTASGALVSGTLTDAIFKIIGTDYVAINGFTMLENPANTTAALATNNMTEWGVALLYASTTDGAQHNIITNCVITLGSTYPNAFGIYSNVRHNATAPTVVADITDSTGANSYNQFSLNTISNVNIGICAVGSNTGNNMDRGLDITQNGISNFGVSATYSAYVTVAATGVNGVYLNNQQGFSLSLNAIASSVGGVTGTGTIRGIYVQTAGTLPVVGAFTRSMTNNSINVRGGNAANILQGIVNEGGNSNINLVISNNNFAGFNYTVAATGAVTFISNTGATLSQALDGNNFNNVSINSSGSVNFFVNAVLVPATGSMSISNNTVVTGFAKTVAGGTITVFTSNASSVNGAVVTMSNNNFSNITLTGATGFTGINNTDGASAVSGPTKSINNNTFNNISGGTGTMNIMTVNFSGPNSTANSNTITNISWGATVTAITTGGSNQATFSVNSNIINTISTTAGAIIGISNAAPTSNVSSNRINTLSAVTAVAVTGITSSGATLVNILKNKIYDLQSNNATGTVFGLTISAGITVNANNNVIGDLRAPLTSSTTDAVRGINLTSATATSNLNIYYNSVYINATSAGANFNTSGLFHTTSATATTATLNMRNNLLVNLSTPNGSGVTSAYRRSNATLTNYGSSSNNNLLYAGTPGASRLIFFDGTNSDQTIAAYKSRVAPRDANSVTENPAFMSTTGSNANFLKPDSTIATFIESGAGTIATYNDDYNGTARYPNAGYPNNLSFPAFAPDLGAYEFGGIWNDVNPPVITYTVLGNTGNLGNRQLTATITDPSGVAGGANSPRLYYKKSADVTWQFDAAPVVVVNDYTFTINAASLGGVAPGDVIQYYVAAQDLNGIAGTNPLGGSGANPPGTTPPGVPNSYTISAAPMAGDYTVGLALFSLVSGKNITIEERVRTVKMNVTESVESKENVSERSSSDKSVSSRDGISGTENLASYEKQISSQAPEVTYVTKEVEVEEKYYVLIANGKEYNGESYIELTKEQKTQFGLTDNMVGIYTTITAAVADVNLRGVSADTRLLLTDATYPTETFPIDFNNSSESAPNASRRVSVKPSTSVTTLVEGSSANGLFRFMGSYITIDGSNTVGGTTRNLTLRNTNASGPDVVFLNGGSLNAVKHSILESGNTSATSGTVVFSTTTGTGNNGDTLRNNSIRDRSDLAGVPANSVYSAGTIGNANGGNVIEDNDIFNFTGNGILVTATGTGDGWRVINNNIYQTAARTTAMEGIQLLGGANGHTISFNDIGGTAPGATGSHLATNNTFRGIDVLVGTGTETGIHGNVIRNIRSTLTGVFTASYGIFVQGGKVNMGQFGLNQVGDSDPNLRYEISGDSYGIRVTSVSTCNIVNNIVDNMGTASTAPTGEYYWGMLVEGTGGAHTVENNIVRNVTNASTPDASFNVRVFGLLVSATGASIIRNNQVYNVGATSTTISPGPATRYQVWSMLLSGTGAGTIAERNKIYNNYASSPGTGALGDLINGIQVEGASSVTVANNMITLTGGAVGDKSVFGMVDLSTGTVSNFYYNSVVITGTASGANGTFAYARSTAAALTSTLRNNILSNYRTGGTGKHYGLGNFTPAAGTFSSDYNLVIANTANQFLSNVTDYDFAAWKTTIGQDLNSLATDLGTIPSAFIFADVPNGDLNVITGGGFAWYPKGNGLPLSAINNDFGGGSRSSTIAGGATCIGADEFVPSGGDIVQVGSIVADGVYPFAIAGKPIGAIVITGYTTPFSISWVHRGGVNPPGASTEQYANGYDSVWVSSGSFTATSYELRINATRNSLRNISDSTTMVLTKSNNGGASWNLSPGVTNGYTPGAPGYAYATGLTSFSLFAITSTNNPLPVELSSFTSAVNRNVVKLSWTTTMEQNNAGFDIERKSVSSQTWNKVGNVTGNGNSSQSKNYTFTDNINTGNYNYRLKQIDFNGNFNYFDLSGEVIVGVPGDFKLSQNYPNPFNPTTKVDYDLPVDSKVNLRVYDMLGREVASLVNEQVTAGYYTVQLNASNLSSGTYFFRLVAQGTNGKEFVMTKKMQLIK